MCRIDHCLMCRIDDCLMCRIDDGRVCRIDDCLMCRVDDCLMWRIDDCLMWRIDDCLVWRIDDCLVCRIDEDKSGEIPAVEMKVDSPVLWYNPVNFWRERSVRPTEAEETISALPPTLVLRCSASERRWNNLKPFHAFYLNAKARIWP